MKLLNLHMLIKQKSPLLPGNLDLRTFDELLIVFSTKINLLYLHYSTAQKRQKSPSYQGDKGEGGKKVPPTSFSPVTSTNVGISNKNILTFSFNLFATLV